MSVYAMTVDVPNGGPYHHGRLASGQFELADILEGLVADLRAGRTVTIMPQHDACPDEDAFDRRSGKTLKRVGGRWVVVGKDERVVSDSIVRRTTPGKTLRLHALWWSSSDRRVWALVDSGANTPMRELSLCSGEKWALGSIDSLRKGWVLPGWLEDVVMRQYAHEGHPEPWARGTEAAYLEKITSPTDVAYRVWDRPKSVSHWLRQGQHELLDSRTAPAPVRAAFPEYYQA